MSQLPRLVGVQEATMIFYAFAKGCVMVLSIPQTKPTNRQRTIPGDVLPQLMDLHLPLPQLPSWRLSSCKQRNGRLAWHSHSVITNALMPSQLPSQHLDRARIAALGD
jgi:hypothetical protein